MAFVQARLWLPLLLFVAGIGGCAAASGGHGPEIHDLDHVRHYPLDLRAEPASVVVFISPWCPIVNSYAVTFRRLQERFPEVTFYFVHADPDVTVAVAREHATKYQLPGVVLLDPQQELRRALDARVTPEAFVIERGAVRYRGQVDNLFLDFGKRLVAATRHALHDALAAVTTGGTVEVPSVPALGCDIPDLE
ncbi:MAG: redoxin domain-containing protein [Planctomycetota bacterium]